jgi:hypothetical protein
VVRTVTTTFNYESGHCHDAKTAADNVAIKVPEIDEDYLDRNPF